MKKFKKFTAMCLAAAMACVSATAYADEVIETTPEPQTLEVYCPGANDDPEFPFNFDIDVEPSSISYIDLDEPIYGFDRQLDSKLLDFDVKFTLKDEYKDFDGFEFQVLDADYTEEIAAGVFENDEVFTIPGLSIGTTYKLSTVLNSETLTAYYGGQFTIQAELDSTLAVDLFYQLADMDGEAEPYEDIDYENNAANNNENTPDILRNNISMIGTCAGTDKDHFKFTTEKNDCKVAKVTFSLKVPAGSGRTFEVTNSAINFHKIIGSGVGSAKTLFITAFNVPWDSSFSIKITFSGGSGSESYTLKASSVSTLAWYGQYISKYDGGEFWNTNKLNALEYSNKPIFEENGTLYSSWFGTACGATGSAMILRNLGATMQGYDFRTGKTGALPADPFTVLLASCNLNGTTMNLNSTTFPTPKHYDDPSTLYSGYVSNNFSVNYNKFINNDPYVPLSLISTSQENMIRNAIDSHDYVLIYLNNSKTPHFMVLTKLEEYNSSDPKTFENRATVYDPAAMTYTAGMGVLLSQTSWYKSDPASAALISARYYY